MSATQLSVDLVEAARITSLHRDTLRDAINKGQLKAKRVGRKLVIKVAALDEWLDQLEDA